MKALRDNPRLAVAVPAFRVVANLEALSWAGLLIGMLFKYVIEAKAELGETLVMIFGSIHGGLVIAYLALAILTAMHRGWQLRNLAFAAIATIPPFATVLFDQWADRTGLYSRPACSYGSSVKSNTS